ncbi:EF-hand domain-containing protein [uncultured Algibacter sp.]|uniref:EF-hand domain-containing protein n=1 Tax=uncultured Algibacter sp. TaxID=298659 RepID=UPI00262B7734|nr:EF-hand domain-containing protein [uncultured Algibacter sp.]
MKSRILKLGVLSLLSFAFTLTISAQEPKGPNFEKMFKRFDTDKNEFISLEEWTSFKRKKEIPIERLEKNYAAMDTDGNGQLTLGEMKANWGKGRGKKKGKK